MLREPAPQQYPFEMVILDELVPQDHLCATSMPPLVLNSSATRFLTFTVPIMAAPLSTPFA